MKPDQHKKKRSAQYKRKHGIAQKKEVTNTSKATVPSSSSSTVRASETQTTLASSAKPSAESQERVSSQMRSQNKDFTQDESEEVRCFSRRKIESNWNRYEPGDVGNDDISYDGLKGADFKTLLNQTGDASSQFRFKDEQLWDNDQTDIDNEQGPEGFPAIDCHDLSQRLMAIPLPVRLNIDSSFFEASMLKSMDEIALRHKEKLDRAPAKRIWIPGSHDEASLVFSSQVLDASTDNESMEDNNGFPDSKDEKTTADSFQDILQHPLDDALKDNDTIPEMEDEKTREKSLTSKEDISQHLVNPSDGHSEDNSKCKAPHESRMHQTSSCMDEVEKATEDSVAEKEAIRCFTESNNVVESDRTQIDTSHAAKEDGKAHQKQSEMTLDLTVEQRNNQTSVTITKNQADAKSPVSSSPQQNFQAKTRFHSEQDHTTVETEDDELDFLLLLENPVQTRSKLVISGRHEEGEEEGGNERRSSPLSLHQEADDVQSKSTPNLVKSPSSTQNGSGSLDDWLDSVLGD